MAEEHNDSSQIVPPFDSQKSFVDRLRIVLAFLAGFIAAFAAMLLFHEIENRGLLLYPYNRFIEFSTSGLFDSFLGALVAGFIMRKHGAFLGAAVAYCFVLISLLVFKWLLSWWLITPPLAFGLTGGKLGELLSRVLFKPPSSSIIQNSNIAEKP